MTTYNVAHAIVTDQAQKVRRSETDALGRLIKVIEDPQGLNYEMTYSYDVISNLVGVVQGTQAGSFSYSSLSRLISAQYPEIGQNGNGTIQYGYDSNGNLSSRIDPRNIRTEYSYDALNRVTLRHYTDGVTPDVTYFYDTLTRGKGRLTSVSSAISQTSYTGYDALGRITGSTQVTSGQTYTMPEYKYNLAGGLTSEIYPSGRVVTTQYDAAGRLSQVAGQKTGEAAKTYADSFSYTSHGAVNSLKLGNNLWEHFSYNARLQPIQITLGTTANDSSKLQLDYAYGTTDNNGNVQSQTITLPGLSVAQSYTYDQLNRLKSLTETGGLTQAYDYDRYGNRAVTAGYIEQQSITPALQSLSSFNQNNNRIVSAAYDSAGNLQSAVAGHLFSYDAENKMVSHDDAQTVGVVDNQYFYDEEGRVKNITGSVTTIYVYDTMGMMVAEYTNGNPLPLTSGTSYLTTDHLGTPIMITNSQGAVISRHDYMPFGEEIHAETAGRIVHLGYVGDVRQKFTGKERGSETELDYFNGRYYSRGQGRFMSVDPLMASRKMGPPQSWNRYMYVLNNPVRLIDPMGLKLSVGGKDAS